MQVRNIRMGIHGVMYLSRVEGFPLGQSNLQTFMGVIDRLRKNNLQGEIIDQGEPLPYLGSTKTFA